MVTDRVASAFLEDYRLADFKLLLPIAPERRTLVIGLDQLAFLAHLAGELGTIDLVVEPPLDSELHVTLAGLAALSAPERMHRIAAPRGTYDLVFCSDLSAAEYLRPGGVLCRFLGHEPAAVPADLIPIGRWRAYPGWPAFRSLIPDNPAGWRAAARDLRLFPARSSLGLRARVTPGAAARLLPNTGIALYRRPGGDPHPSVLGAMRGALASLGSDPIRDTPDDQWFLMSGRLGPGNPILAFSLDPAGHPRRLIKVARFAGGQHLRAEVEQLDEIERALGTEGARRVIRPTASAMVAGRWGLAYTYEPTHAFYGLRWRVQTRARFCRGMADWLGTLALATRRRVTSGRVVERQVAPLRALVERQILPSAVQRHAASALTDLEHLAPSLPFILEHGDLGIYNARLVRADGSDFRVLDWGSSTFEGIPLGDLCYLLSSARAPARLACRCLADYLLRLGLRTGDASALWFGYLARRWAELDQVRPPTPGDLHSGGGILLPVHQRVASYLRALGRC
jgi:hypothetical protein